MSGKQDQSASDGSIAIQARGDVNIGLQPAEVRELVQIFLDSHLPAEAATIAKANTE